MLGWCLVLAPLLVLITTRIKIAIELDAAKIPKDSDSNYATCRVVIIASDRSCVDLRRRTACYEMKVIHAIEGNEIFFTCQL